MMWPFVILRLSWLVYYTQLGSISDLIFIIILSVWKIGCWRLASIIATNGLTLAASSLILAFFSLLELARRLCSKNEFAASNHLGRPLLFPCRITNTLDSRSPERPALLLGVPVGWSGVAGGLISVDYQSSTMKPWYTIDVVNHLLPGPSHLGMRGKLDEFLASQGIKACRFPFAYFATTTGSTGPQHNHLSLWYLYSARKQLEAMIIEIRNDNTKRQLHFLSRDDKVIEDTNCGSIVTSPSARETCHENVSKAPLHFRNGVCLATASDSCSPNVDAMECIDTTCELTPPETRSKFTARIISTAKPIGPKDISLKKKLSLVARWRWSGITSLTRIGQETIAGLYKKKYGIWDFSKLLNKILAQHTNEVERGLEVIFRNYLRYLVRQSTSSLRVRYVPASIPDAPDEVMWSPAAKSDKNTAQYLELKVMDPAFYSRFVCYAHDFEAMFCELSENHTIEISEPTLLPKLVLKKPSPPLSTASYLDYAYFTAIKRLRRLPKKIQQHVPPSQPANTTSLGDIRGFRLSSMDGYVLADAEEKTRYLYRHLVLKVFIADRITRGSIGMLSLAILFFRILLAWIVAFP
ncbi:hypothetical protein F4808DRAFT_185476 [Astrocystis sublimbata]|nr:hypothetical protein F4808DRAFT_185476 [Astrocystis sublimbata]